MFGIILQYDERDRGFLWLRECLYMSGLIRSASQRRCRSLIWAHWFSVQRSLWRTMVLIRILQLGCTQIRIVDAPELVLCSGCSGSRVRRST